MISGETLKPFPLRSGKREGCQLLPLTFNLILKVLKEQLGKEKRNKEKEKERKGNKMHSNF
jgi:hypothetical protein